MKKDTKEQQLIDTLVSVSCIAFVLYTIVVFVTGQWIGHAGKTVTVTKTVEVMPWLDHYDYEALMQCVADRGPQDQEPEKCFSVIRKAHAQE